MIEKAGTIWDSVLARIQTKVTSPQAYYTWFRSPTSLAKECSGVQVPIQSTIDGWSTRAERITTSRADGEALRVTFRCGRTRMVRTRRRARCPEASGAPPGIIPSRTRASSAATSRRASAARRGGAASSRA